MRARFFCLKLLAGVFAFLAECAVANALMTTETQFINNLSTTKITFTVENDGTDTAVKPDTNSPQTATQTLTFNKFNNALGILTAVTITLTSDYDVTVTVTATNRSDEIEDGFETTTFFAETKNPFGQKLTGSAISDLLPLTTPTFSASCVLNTFGTTCVPDPTSQVSNNNDFSRTASLALPLTSFSGPGTFDLVATLSSALAPRIFPDNDTGNFADNSTFTGTLTHRWDGKVDVVYTYNPFVTPVPEPLSLYLFAAGLGGIALSGRRRR